MSKIKKIGTDIAHESYLAVQILALSEIRLFTIKFESHQEGAIPNFYMQLCGQGSDIALVNWLCELSLSAISDISYWRTNYARSTQ